MAKILLVEDDKQLAESIIKWLQLQQFDVEQTASGDDALQLLAVNRYDIIVLDWTLTDTTGVQVCRTFRTRGGTTPVLMLTGKGDVSDKVQALDLGADDYVTKPFNMQELTARLRAMLRRGTVTPSNRIAAGSLEIDRTTHDAFLNGAILRLYPKEFNLLELFMTNPGRPFRASDLLTIIWNLDSDASEETVRTYVKTLRRKTALPGGESPIKTERGVGYKFEVG
jgi:DNA-binding response OmpR family regulator